MMTSVGYGYLMSYNSEIYPTQFRALTIGTALFIARIFAAITPFIIHLANLINVHPMVFASLIAVVILPFLTVMPETKGKKIET
jgi:hypothetical protein